MKFKEAAYCLPQRLKSKFFEIISNAVARRGLRSEKKLSKKHVILGLGGNQATTHTNCLLAAQFFKFLAYCTHLIF